MFLKHYGEILERNREAANTKWKLTLGKKKTQQIKYKEEMTMLLAERIKDEFCQLSRSRKGKWETAEEDHKDKGTVSIEEATAKFLGGPGTWNDSGRKSYNQKSERKKQRVQMLHRGLWFEFNQVNCLLKEKTKTKTQYTERDRATRRETNTFY